MSDSKEYDDWEASLDQNYLDQLRPDAFELSPDAFYAGQQSQQAKIDNLQKENDKLNIWYKNVKLQLENKQIDCDRSDREIDELQKKYDAMYNAFIVADDCRKEWHESYMSARKDRDELQGRIDTALSMLCRLQYSSGERIYSDVGNILKGNKDEN